MTAALATQSLSGRWVVETAGTDLVGVFGLPFVDAENTSSNSVVDTQEALGIEAAVVTAYREIRRLIGTSDVNRRHSSLFSDFVTFTGHATSISRHGMPDNGCGELQRAMYERPLATAIEAALRGAIDPISSVSSSLFVGNLTSVGTGACSVVYDFNAATVDEMK